MTGGGQDYQSLMPRVWFMLYHPRKDEVPELPGFSPSFLTTYVNKDSFKVVQLREENTSVPEIQPFLSVVHKAETEKVNLTEPTGFVPFETPIMVYEYLHFNDWPTWSEEEWTAMRTCCEKTCGDMHQCTTTSNCASSEERPEWKALGEHVHNKSPMSKSYERGHVAHARSHLGCDSFHMANIVAQTAASNHGKWLAVENQQMKWLRENQQLIIVAGPWYKQQGYKWTCYPDASSSGQRPGPPDALYKILLKKSERETTWQLCALVFNNDGKTMYRYDYDPIRQWLLQLKGNGHMSTHPSEFNLAEYLNMDVFGRHQVRPWEDELLPKTA